MRKIIRSLVLWDIGGQLYFACELIFRGYSHWTMFVVGGLCFLMVGAINEILPWTMPIWMQAIIGSCIVTAMEFASGCIINLWLGWHVWDYSDMPLNLLGQICLPFSLLWIPVSAVAIVLDDLLRHWIWKKRKPVYYWTFIPKRKDGQNYEAENLHLGWRDR